MKHRYRYRRGAEKSSEGVAVGAFADGNYDQRVKGVAWFVLSTIFYTIANVSLLAIGEMNVVYVAFLRAVAIALCLMPWLAFHPSTLLKCNWRVLIICAVGSLGTNICWFAALQKLPLSTATAIFSVKSLVIYVFAWWWLREKVSGKVVLANLICIFGAVLMLNPEAAVISGLLLTVGAAAFSALTSLGIARSAIEAHFMPTLFLTSVLQFIVLLPIILIERASSVDVVEITQFDSLAIAASGLASLINLACMAKAFRTAPMNEMVSSEHLRIPMAMGASAFLSDRPMSPTYLVGCLTILSGLAISLFTRRNTSDRVD